jgi:CheY-like chemotaxis protein
MAKYMVYVVMQGKIKLESRQDSGTVATFSIPFNKPQFIGASTPLVDLGAVPERLQSELSLSCDNSSQAGNLATGTSSPYNSPKHKPTPSTSPENVTGAPPLKAATMGAASSSGHILIVEDNSINQQIALKTIRRLGYSASAVSNGQEALRYLLKAAENATSPGAHKLVDNYTLPSLILMDVQMPVLDGYKATHTLRHHAPFKSMTLIQQIPIVAMTASAIQGDREKCERAGMNDYLAKPVKRTTLEKMIHKWITSENQLRLKLTNIKSEDRDSTRPDLCRSGTTSTDHSSNCPGADYQITEAQNDGNFPGSRRASSAQSPLNLASMSRIENASDRGLRFVETAEMAASLRDAKLISAAAETDEYGALGSTVSLGSAANPSATGSHMFEAYPDQHGSSLELTEENIEKLNADSADDCLAKLQIPPTPMGRPQDRISGPSAAAVESLVSTPIPVAAVSEALATPVTDSPAEISPRKSKRGQLSPSDRKPSDWSNASTAKP